MSHNGDIGYARIWGYVCVDCPQFAIFACVPMCPCACVRNRDYSTFYTHVCCVLCMWNRDRHSVSPCAHVRMRILASSAHTTRAHNAHTHTSSAHSPSETQRLQPELQRTHSGRSPQATVTTLARVERPQPGCKYFGPPRGVSALPALTLNFARVSASLYRSLAFYFLLALAPIRTRLCAP